VSAESVGAWEAAESRISTLSDRHMRGQLEGTLRVYQGKNPVVCQAIVGRGMLMEIRARVRLVDTPTGIG
jgi:hypothetical protein